MLSMTDYPTPKFPAMATPEEVKAASEKVMNFWVGALSPMWVPFWAASGFGLSAWAMTQSLSKNEGMLKDLPQMGELAKWPGFGGAGFGGIWGAAAARTEAAAEATAAAKTEAVTKTVEPVVKATKVAVKAAPKVAKAAAVKTIDTTTAVAKTAVKAAGDTVAKAVDVALEPKVAFDPVIEAPVAVSEAVVEAPAVLKAASPKIEPKPIARAMSAVKKPKTS